MKFESKFKVDDRIIIDGDQSLRGTVTSFQFRPINAAIDLVTIEVSYVHNGTVMTAWVEERRLSIAP